MNALAPTPALKSHLDAQVSLLTDLAARMYDAIHRVTALNLKLAQQLLDDNLAASRRVMATSDPVERCAVLVAGGVPASEHLRGYQQQLLNIIAGTHVELGRSAGRHLPATDPAAGDTGVAEQRHVVERMAAAVPDGGATPPAP